VRRSAAVLLCLIAALVLPAAAKAQTRAVRFLITTIGDSTIEFRTGSEKWIRPGQLGVAVDPRRRDELIARFRIESVREGSATAVITGQTTAVSPEHVAVLDEPRRSAYRSPAFWIGITVGAALGFIGGMVSK
jgi:hypothetical protein